MLDAEKAEASGPGPDSGKQSARSAPPQDAIDVDRPSVEVMDELLERLAEKVDRSIIITGGKLSRVAFRGKTRIIEQHDRASLHIAVADRVPFVRWNRGSKRYEPTDPPSKVLDLLLALDQYPTEFPRVERIVECPILTADGELLVKSGVYLEHRVYLSVPKQLRGITVPDTVTDEDVEVAVSTIWEPFQDFAFRDECSGANLLAMLFTLLLRGHIDGVVPLFLITGNQPGVGKGLICRLLSLLVFGHDAAFSPGNTSSDELRKRLLAMALEGVVFVVLDNVEAKLWSSDLAAWLTAPLFRDRILGESTTALCDNTMVFAATGNRIQIGGDLARRSVLVELESDHAAPHERQDFAHGDVVTYVREHRAELLEAAYTIAAAWLRKGCPVPGDAPRMGSFESWSAMLAGLLDTAGVEGFLGNRDRLRGQDADAEEMNLLLVRACEAFGDKAFSARDLAGILAPDEVPTRVGRSSEATLPKSLGHLLTRVVGRPFGSESLVVRRSDRMVDHRWMYHIERMAAR